MTKPNRLICLFVIKLLRWHKSSYLALQPQFHSEKEAAPGITIVPPWPFPGLQVTFLWSVYFHKEKVMCCFLQSLDCSPTHSCQSAQLVTTLLQAVPQTAILIQPQLDSHCPRNSSICHLCPSLLSSHMEDSSDSQGSPCLRPPTLPPSTIVFSGEETYSLSLWDPMFPSALHKALG